MSLSHLSNLCTPGAIPFPTVPGANFTNAEISLVQNYSLFVPHYYNPNHGDIDAKNMSFCNVTLTHTHSGQNNSIVTQVWLPIQPAWNERLQATGGGGWAAGFGPGGQLQMSGAAAEGYATVTTDAGIPSPSPDTWALPSPGHVDRTRLQDFASVGLHDAALAAKSLITNFYGQGPKYSYWSGCSQGGRQGYMFAQQYPDVFDGIAAASPAINAAFLTAAQFPQQVMNEMKEYPRACELDALTTAAIKACDGDDGAVDGIISDPDKCHFSPYPLVGTVVNCSSISSPTTMRISEAAAKVADAAWNGARGANGTFLWYTPGHAANLTNTDLGVAVTDCSTNATCTGQGVSLVTDWIRLFVEKDAKFDVTSMSRQEYERVFRAGVAEYDTIIGTNSPDLSAFRKAGGKMITYHGQADQLVPFRNTRHYYDTVTAIDSSVHDYYRLFEAPGLSHCSGGNGYYPSGAFGALVQWVEGGVVPDMLEATSPDNRSTVLYPYSK